MYYRSWRKNAISEVIFDGCFRLREISITLGDMPDLAITGDQTNTDIGCRTCNDNNYDPTGDFEIRLTRRVEAIRVRVITNVNQVNETIIETNR